MPPPIVIIVLTTVLLLRSGEAVLSSATGLGVALWNTVIVGNKRSTSGRVSALGENTVVASWVVKLVTGGCWVAGGGGVGGNGAAKMDAVKPVGGRIK